MKAPRDRCSSALEFEQTAALSGAEHESPVSHRIAGGSLPNFSRNASPLENTACGHTLVA
jgi:hypothetical protein